MACIYYTDIYYTQWHIFHIMTYIPHNDVFVLCVLITFDILAYSITDLLSLTRSTFSYQIYFLLPDLLFLLCTYQICLLVNVDLTVKWTLLWKLTSTYLYKQLKISQLYLGVDFGLGVLVLTLIFQQFYIFVSIRFSWVGFCLFSHCTCCV